MFDLQGLSSNIQDLNSVIITEVTPSLEERHGGPSKSVYELSRAISSAGHTVQLLSTDLAPDALRREDTLTVRTFRRDWPRSLCFSSHLRHHLNREPGEVIHHHALWLRTLHYANKAASAGIPLVLSPRGMMSHWAWNHHGIRKRLAGALVHPGALSRVSGWHATSEAEAIDIRALGFRQPICVAPNGVSAPTPEQLQEASAHWIEACPEAAGRPVALFYSRFHRKKRLLELIDLWAERAPKDWLLLLVGIPEEYSVDLLEDYVIRVVGRHRVRVFSGLGRPPPYAVASLFVLPSHSENFGLSIAEAMANGVPALVTDTTPWEGVNGRGGWCVPWSAFGNALQAATDEGPERLRQRGVLAKEWVLREYSWEVPARALVEFYAKLKAPSA